MTTRSRNKKVEEENVPFVKNIEMRANRGSKIKNLLDKKAQESDSDDFWKNNKYFGSFNDVMNESEDSEEYSQKSDVPDVFDEDFGAESDSDEDEDEDDEEDLQGKKKAQGISIFKKPEADVKKFIEKDDKKTKMKPAIAALKRTTARNKAKAEAEAKAKAKAKAEAEAEAKAIAKAEAEAAAAAAEKASVKKTPTPVKKAPTPVKKALKRAPTPDEKETPKASPAKIETSVRTGSTRLAAKAAEKAKVMEEEAKEPSPPKVETKTITFVVNAEKKSQKQIKVTLEAVIPLKTTKAKPAKAAILKPSKTSQAKSTAVIAATSKGDKAKTMEIEQSSEPESVSMSTRGGQEKRNAMAKPAPKVPTFKKPTKGSRVNPKQEVVPEALTKKKGKYIHDFYSQEELMKEAALTEIYNKKSLDSLLQIEADQKDSYLVNRRLEIDEPSVKYVSKKVNDQEQRYIVLSDNKAYELYFGNMPNSSSTNLKKRPLPEETPEEVQDLDETDIVRKKLFITNAQFKLAEIKRNLQNMEAEEEKIDKQLDALKDLLHKKIKHLKA